MKIAIYGDSISEGIGKKKVNYSEFIRDGISEKYDNVIIDNFAHTGTTIKYLDELLCADLVQYDAVIIGYGNVDGMLRPDMKHRPNYYKLLPSRYKQNGMLNPRPYYSSRYWKKTIQHLDSIVRTNLNRILLSRQGATTWVTVEEFEKIYRNCITKIRYSNKDKKIILLSTVRVGDKYFPGTNRSYEKFNAVIQKIAKQESCIYISLYEELNDPKFFYEDLFHPNIVGYKEIANKICKYLLNGEKSDGEKSDFSTSGKTTFF